MKQTPATTCLLGGTAQPDDMHLAADIRAIDDGILAWLERRERRRGKPHTQLRYFCSPQHKDSPLYPIIGQMQMPLD